MKMFIFVFLVFMLLVGYVFARGYYCFSGCSLLKYSYMTIYVLLFTTMISVFVFADQLPVKIGSAISFVGYTFLMLVIFMAMCFLLIDLFRIINRLFIHLTPDTISTVRLWATGASFALVVIMLIVGNYKFNHPKVNEINISVENPVHNKTLRIVAASDLHLGANIGKKKVQQYVELINEQKPDIVLLAGDIADRSIDPVEKQNMYEDLLKIKSTYGVYGASGNHEYYSMDKDRNFEYYEKSGIHMLIDQAVLVDSSFYVLGRDDRTNKDRKELSALVAGLDKNFPVIMMDHQPFQLEEAQENGITLQISGHTHNGQFFPGNLIVKSMYELPYGYKQKGNTHYYVSSGLGLWGPEYRIGTVSELVVINLKY